MYAQLVCTDQGNVPTVALFGKDTGFHHIQAGLLKFILLESPLKKALEIASVAIARILGKV